MDYFDLLFLLFLLFLLHFLDLKFVHVVGSELLLHQRSQQFFVLKPSPFLLFLQGLLTSFGVGVTLL